MLKSVLAHLKLGLADLVRAGLRPLALRASPETENIMRQAGIDVDGLRASCE